MGVCIALLLSAPALVRAADQETASRIGLKTGETQQIPASGLDAVISVNESVATVTRTATGFSITARTAGETLIQAFSAAGLVVYVVTVLPAPPPPPGPAPAPRIDQAGPITSFWADNRYSLRFIDSTTSGMYAQHMLTLRGRVHGGEYRSTTSVLTGGLGSFDTMNTQLQVANLNWISDRRDLTLEVGDAGARLHGSTLLAGVSLRGARAARTYKIDGRGEWGHELFIGEMRGPGDPTATRLDQPAVGGTVFTSFSPARMKELRLTLGSSAIAFSTAGAGGNAGQSAVVLGATGRAVHKNGFGFELRAGLSTSAAHRANAPVVTAASVNATAQYQSDEGMHRLEYEGNQRGFASPQNSMNSLGLQRVSAMFSRRIRKVTGSGNATWTRTTDPFGRSIDGLSYRFSVAAPVNRQATFTLAGGETNAALFLTAPGGIPALSPWSQRQIGARLEYYSEQRDWAAQSEVSYLSTESAEGKSIGSIATATVQHQHEGRWNVSGVATFTASQLQSRTASTVESVLAVDQQPMNVGGSVGVQGRFIKGPFESFGGLGLQATALPAVQTAPMVNIGIQFTPTAAHQLVATFNTLKPFSARSWYHTTSVNYTYHFGASVKAAPLFEFMSYGVIEGRICFDENSDGVCAPSEPPIPAIRVRLSNGMGAQTDRQGWYRFERLKPGFYHVDVDEDAMRDRGRPTTVLAAAFDLPVRGTEGRDFAVARACRLQGHVVNDLDLDARRDENEHLFGGSQVVASGPAGTFPIRVNNLGVFSSMLPCGEYTVELEPSSLPALWLPSGDGVRVKLGTGEAATAELFVKAVRTIAGDVFLDRNGNGKKDAGEPAVAGAVVRFDGRSGPSDETGAFLLRSVPAMTGNVTVDPATLPAGMKPGTPIELTIKSDPTALEDLHIAVVPAP